jgi:hypothetical protein
MTKAKSISSLVTTTTPKATSSTILIRGKLSSVGMSYSTKKENGIGDQVMKTTTSQFDEDDVEPEEPREDPATPLASPTLPSSEDTGSERIVTRTRSLQDIYTQIPYHHEDLKISMRKLSEKKISHYYVSPQITNQGTFKKLHKMEYSNMQRT